MICRDHEAVLCCAVPLQATVGENKDEGRGCGGFSRALTAIGVSEVLSSMPCILVL